MSIDPRLAVFEIQQRHPAVLPVFAKYKIDLCCGGRHPLEEVAQKHGFDLPHLLIELEEALKTSP